jgi:hypothetical protein
LCARCGVWLSLLLTLVLVHLGLTFCCALPCALALLLTCPSADLLPCSPVLFPHPLRRVLATVVRALKGMDILPASIDMAFVEERGGLQLQFLKALFHILGNPKVTCCGSRLWSPRMLQGLWVVYLGVRVMDCGVLRSLVSFLLCPHALIPPCRRRSSFLWALRQRPTPRPVMWLPLPCCLCWRGAATVTCSVVTTWTLGCTSTCACSSGGFLQRRWVFVSVCIEVGGCLHLGASL